METLGILKHMLIYDGTYINAIDGNLWKFLEEGFVKNAVTSTECQSVTNTANYCFIFTTLKLVKLFYNILVEFKRKGAMATNQISTIAFSLTNHWHNI